MGAGGAMGAPMNRSSQGTPPDKGGGYGMAGMGAMPPGMNPYGGMGGFTQSGAGGQSMPPSMNPYGGGGNFTQSEAMKSFGDQSGGMGDGSGGMGGIGGLYQNSPMSQMQGLQGMIGGGGMPNGYGPQGMAVGAGMRGGLGSMLPAIKNAASRSA